MGWPACVRFKPGLMLKHKGQLMVFILAIASTFYSLFKFTSFQFSLRNQQKIRITRNFSCKFMSKPILDKNFLENTKKAKTMSTPPPPPAREEPAVDAGSVSSYEFDYVSGFNRLGGGLM